MQVIGFRCSGFGLFLKHIRRNEESLNSPMTLRPSAALRRFVSLAGFCEASAGAGATSVALPRGVGRHKRHCRRSAGHEGLTHGPFRPKELAGSMTLDVKTNWPQAAPGL